MSCSSRIEEPSSVRVALVGCTGLLGDIVRRTVREVRSIDVVAELDVDALQAEVPAAADLVVWHNADEAAVSQWLGNLDVGPRVLATIADGRAASLWELRPARTQLGELSPAMLIDAIRACTPSRANPDSQEQS